MRDRISFLRPTFPSVDEVAEDYAEILRTRRFSNCGAFERRFASVLSEWVGGDIGISLVSNGTTGIQLAVSATFIPGRSFALVASFTFAAGPLTLKARGFKPVFVDIDADTWQPNIEHAAEFLESSGAVTAGILLTNTFGVANEEVASWEVLAQRHGIPLVIDSAAGFGSSYASGERLGARGVCEVFSLHATKTLGVGEGGLITTRDRRLLERLDRMKNFGFDETRSAVELGTNGKLSELMCAIGIRQLAALPTRLAERRRILDLYIDSLGTGGFEFQVGARRSALPFVSALVPVAAARRAVLDALEDDGVEARDYYNPPVHMQPVFRGSTLVRAPLVTSDVASKIISLPMNDDLTSDDVARIAQICRRVCGAEAVSSG